MTAYTPVYRIKVDGSTVTGATLGGLTITSGRTEIYQQPVAGVFSGRLGVTEMPSEGTWEGWKIFTGMVLALAGVEAIANMTGTMKPDPDSPPGAPSVHREARRAISIVMIEVVLITAVLGVMVAGMPAGSFVHPESFLRTMADFYISPQYGWVVAIVVLTFLVGCNYVWVCKFFPEGGGVYHAARILSPRLGVIGALLLLAGYVVTAAISGYDAYNYFGLREEATRWAILTIFGLGVVNAFGPRLAGSLAVYLALPAVLVLLGLS